MHLPILTKLQLTSCVLSSRTSCSAGVRRSRQEVKGGPCEGLERPGELLASLLGRRRIWSWLSLCWVRRKVSVFPSLILHSTLIRRTTDTPKSIKCLQIMSTVMWLQWGKKRVPLTDIPGNNDSLLLYSKGKWVWEVLGRVINIKSAALSGTSTTSRCFYPHPGDLTAGRKKFVLKQQINSWFVHLSSIY